MLSLLRPSAEQCAEAVQLAKSSSLSYSFPGSIQRGETPRGFSRFRRWRFMPASVVEIISACPIQCDRVVGVLFRGLGVWSLNPARIIRVHDSADEAHRVFGFTYATLEGHVEQGEERFLLYWDLATDEVWYKLDAVSRPNHVLAWIAYPYARWQQSRFRTESCASMKDSVVELSSNPIESCSMRALTLTRSVNSPWFLNLAYPLVS